MSADESQSQDSNEDNNSKSKKNLKKNKKRNNKYSSEDYNSNSEDNENEEEEEDSNDINDDKKSKKSKRKFRIKLTKVEEEPPQKTKDDYIAQIEQLENELQLEQKISSTLDAKNESNDELINLQKNLEEKNNKLNLLIKTNKRQEEALLSLKKQIIEDNNNTKSRNRFNKNNKFLISQKLVNSNSYKNTFNRNNNLIFINNTSNTKKSLDDSKLEAINIVIKIKEKAINNAIAKMNLLKKENENLRKELYKNDDYSNNLGLENNTNENKIKLDKLKDEIIILNGQLEEHKKCISERNLLEKENIKLKKTFQEIKKNIKKIKLDFKEKESELNNNKTVPIDSVEDNITNNINLSPRNNTKTIINSKIQNHRFIPPLNFSEGGVRLPIITTPNKTTTAKNDKNFLDENFYHKLKKYFDDNEVEYEILIKKIKEIENSRSYIENKHKNEIKQFDSKILILDKQFKILNNEGKETGSNIRVLKYKLNIIRNETKNIYNKMQQLNTKMEYLNNIKKDKDYEIFELKSEINKIRNKCEKKKKEETIDSDEDESRYDDGTINESESVLSNGKNKKEPILNLKESNYKKKNKKK